MQHHLSRPERSYRQESALVGGSLLALAIMTVCLILAPPARAEEAPSVARKINQVDVMLLVTSLRCRFGADDFRSEYEELHARHQAEFSEANSQLKAEFLKHDASAAAQRSFDSFITKVANTYGNGHPWLGCAELRSITGTLAKMEGSGPLIEAYGQLVAGAPPQFALASARR